MKRFLFFIMLVAAGCAPQPHVFTFTPTYGFPPEETRSTALGKMAGAEGRGHGTDSGLLLLPKGEDAFIARVALVQAAERSIDLQYYSTSEDSTGRLLLKALLDAADRGVRIRVLIDGWNLDSYESGLALLNNHKNIEMRAFNPYASDGENWLTRNLRLVANQDVLERRMHNKALVVDGSVAIMGGRNLGDEYFGASGTYNFRDIDALAIGPVTAAIAHNFDTYWNSKVSCPLEQLNPPKSEPVKLDQMRAHLEDYWQSSASTAAGSFLKGSTLGRQIRHKDVPFVWAPVRLVADSPRKIEVPEENAASKPEETLASLVEDAQKEFIIVSPYFVPLDDGTGWLTSLQKRGVQVRVLTNSLASTDMVMVHAGYSHYRKKLLSAGVELYELKAVGGRHPRHMFRGSSSQRSLHAKIYIVDRKVLVIGSFNMDPRSERFNTEQVMVIHSPRLAHEVAESIEGAMDPEHSYRVLLKHVAEKPPVHALKAPFPILQDALGWESEKEGKSQHFDYDPEAGLKRYFTDGWLSALPDDDQL